MGDAERVCVVGGGVFGLTAALELRRRGREVVVVDPGPLPHPLAASTDISKLVRPDYGDDPLYTRLMEDCLPGWRRWNARWRRERPDGRALFHETGVLILRDGEPPAGSFEASSFELLRRRGHRPEPLGREDIRARYPAWNADVYTHGYAHRAGGWAESGAVVRWLAEEASRAGVTFAQARAVRVLHEGGGASGRVRGVEVEAEGAGGAAGGARSSIEAGVVVAAAGAWTPTLLPHLRPLLRAVGQAVFHFRVPPPLLPLFSEPLFPGYAADVQRSGFYGFPAHPLERAPDGGGVLKMGHHGAGHPLDPRDGVSDAAIARKLDEVLAAEERKFRAQLERAWPSMRGAEVVFSRLCLYCDSTDTDFLIDHDPERPGLVVATGGSGHGFKFAPLLGEIIADVVERRPNPYAARFRWRSAEEARRASVNQGDAARQAPASRL